MNIRNMNDLKWVCDLPEGSKVLDMVEVDGQLVIALDTGLHVLNGDKLEPLDPYFAIDWNQELKDLVSEGE